MKIPEPIINCWKEYVNMFGTFNAVLLATVAFWMIILLVILIIVGPPYKITFPNQTINLTIPNTTHGLQ
jgi:hypothetical protein